MTDDRLMAKVIVITGASSGFGKGAALDFARAGAFVVLAARREHLLDELVHHCEAAGGRAIALPTDVSDPAEVEQLARQTVNIFGRIDVWVNNAGAGAYGRFEEVPLDAHVQVIETDLLGTLYGSYVALSQFRAQGSGTLINIASVVGKVPAPYLASYTAAKHGVVGLSAALRQELRQNGIEAIRVCTVMPTSMDTPFFDHAANYTGHEAAPVPPLYDPQETIDVILRLASDPEDEVAVGNAAKVSTFLHNVAPGVTEAIMGRQVHKAQMEDAPPAPDTPGALTDPSPIGTGVTGGRLPKPH